MSFGLKTWDHDGAPIIDTTTISTKKIVMTEVVGTGDFSKTHIVPEIIEGDYVCLVRKPGGSADQSMPNATWGTGTLTLRLAPVGAIFYVYVLRS